MWIKIEPTLEKYAVPVNGQTVPCRIWKGTTEGGIAIEAYVVSIVPVDESDAEALHKEVESVLRRSRDVYDIDTGTG